MYQNRVALIGFLDKDAEVRTAPNTQARYTVLSLATKRSYRDRESGERLCQTTWHRCIVRGKLSEFYETLTKAPTSRSRVISARVSMRNASARARDPPR